MGIGGGDQTFQRNAMESVFAESLDSAVPLVADLPVLQTVDDAVRPSRSRLLAGFAVALMASGDFHCPRVAAAAAAPTIGQHAVFPDVVPGRARIVHLMSFAHAPANVIPNDRPINNAELSFYPDIVHGRPKRTHLYESAFRPSRNIVAPVAPTIGEHGIFPDVVYGRPKRSHLMTYAHAPVLLPPPLTPARGPSTIGLLVFDLDGASVTYQTATDVMRSRSGVERRIGLNVTPRDSYEFSVNMTDAQVLALSQQLVINGVSNTPFALGVLTESLIVTGAAGTTINVPTTAFSDWLYSGSPCVVLAPDGVTTHTFTVQNYGASSIGVDASTAGVTVGSRIMPAIPCFIDATVPIDLRTYGAGSVRLTAHAAFYGNASGDWTSRGASVATWTHPFLGVTYPVWDRYVAMAGDTSGRAALTGVELLDYGGARSAVGTQHVAEWPRTLAMTVRTDADRQYIKAFIGAVRGQQSLFWLSTQKPDLTPIGDASSGNLIIDASSVDYAGTWFLSPAHQQLSLLLADGTTQLVGVFDAASIGGGQQQLVLDRAVVGALARVSFLEPARLATDVVKLVYEGGGIARVKLPAVVPYSGYT